MKLRPLVRKASILAWYWSGLGHLYEFAVRPAGAIILMFHSIAEDDVAEFVDPSNRMSPRLFERQMAFLNSSRRVLPLSQVVEQIASGTSPYAGSVCITFDDGYLDNLTVAAPILERYGLPATLFLATGYIDRGEAQWVDTLYWMFNRRTANKLRIPTLLSREMDLTSEEERSIAHKLLLHFLLEASHEERSQMLMVIKHQLLPVGQMPRLTMNWNDVRELQRRYPFIEFGGHTCEHVDLRKHQGELARSEIDGCARALRRELGVEPTLFSFPYGRWCEGTRSIVATSGWQASVVAGDRVRNDNTSDLYAMPRGDTPRTMYELRFMTSGANPGLLDLLGLA